MIAATDEDGLLSEAELVAMGVLLAVAGHETTVNLIANAVLALLRHPAELDRLRRTPWLAPRAVEEGARYESPVQRTWRLTTAAVELGGRAIPAGALVVAVLGAANRDPARFPDPDRFDLARRDNAHLAFGAGAHVCLGAALARLEAQVALGTLVRRFPGLRLATDALGGLARRDDRARPRGAARRVVTHGGADRPPHARHPRGAPTPSSRRSSSRATSPLCSACDGLAS